MSQPLLSLRHALLLILLCVICHQALAQNDPDDQQKSAKIAWTAVPTVDKEDPTLQRGIVYGPDGRPLSGAKIYAASSIELFEIRSANAVTSADLGDVRAETDGLGRFEFHTPDLTWSPAPGKQKRWEALLVATHDGLAPGWTKTWGEDRGLRSHWHPHISKKVEIHLGLPRPLTGRFIDPDRNPVVDAKVKLTAVMLPYNGNIEQHIERLKTPRMFATVDYQETFYRPWLIPGLTTETTTGGDGRFELPGLVQDQIVRIEVSHPKMRTAKLYAAVRDMESILRTPNEFDKFPAPILLGSGFEQRLSEGVTLRGMVRLSIGIGGRRSSMVAGATVALANHNARDGMTGQRFTTDEEGRFEITGLGPDYNDPGYQIAVVGSFNAPIESQRFTLVPYRENRVDVGRAVPYRLKLTEADGQPIDRDVYSIAVQRFPDQTRHGVTYRFDDAVKVAPGVYEGIVPRGPGAVIVKRGSRRDRPAFVDPKAFFEPGRTDWTAAEARYAYGDQWQITPPGIIRTAALTPVRNSPLSQLNMAAVVLTNGGGRDETLELAAQVIKDDPPKVTLVDKSGNPVEGIRVKRQLEKYNGKDMPSTFPLYGLHPERAEMILFYHDKRGLIGFLRAKLTDKPLQVVMKRAAILAGSFVTKYGEPSFDFGAIVEGAVLPRTHLGNFTRNSDSARKGRFALAVPPDATYSGELMRKTHNSWYPRPTLGKAFGPVTPAPGKVIELGEIVVP